MIRFWRGHERNDIFHVNLKQITKTDSYVRLTWEGRKLLFLLKANGTIFIKQKWNIHVLKWSKAHSAQVIHLQCILFSSKKVAKFQGYAFNRDNNFRPSHFNRIELSVLVTCFRHGRFFSSLSHQPEFLLLMIRVLKRTWSRRYFLFL